MFGSSIGAGEILLIFVVVLLFFGAQRLPSIARTLGQAMEELRRAAREFTRDVTGDNPPAPRPPASLPPPPDAPEDKQG